MMTTWMWNRHTANTKQEVSQHPACRVTVAGSGVADMVAGAGIGKAGGVKAAGCGSGEG